MICCYDRRHFMNYFYIIGVICKTKQSISSSLYSTFYYKRGRYKQVLLYFVLRKCHFFVLLIYSLSSRYWKNIWKNTRNTASYATETTRLGGLVVITSDAGLENACLNSAQVEKLSTNLRLVRLRATYWSIKTLEIKTVRILKFYWIRFQI